jgi:acyl-CoA synthetase (AMP-forming)/AMP-acid ligase II
VVELKDAPDLAWCVRRHAAATPDKDALIFVGGQDRADATAALSYASLDEQARTIAAALQARFAVGDRLLLLYPPGVHFVTAFLGCLYAGMVAVPAPLPGTAKSHHRRLDSIAGNASVSTVLTDGVGLAAVAGWRGEDGSRQMDWLVTDDAALGDPRAWTPPGVDREDVALLQYTSGSTGSPKGVVVSHRNLLVNTTTLHNALGLDSDSPIGGWIPLYHDMGLIGHVLPAVLFGATCVLMSPATFLKRPHLWLQAIDKFGLVLSAAPDFAYELCTRRVTDEQLAGLDLSRWRCAGNGSEPVHAATLTAFADRFAAAGFREDAFLPAFGMAEATLFVAGAPHRPVVTTRVDADAIERHQFTPVPTTEPGRDLVSCGPPRDIDVRIVDPDTAAVLPEWRVGEIWLRGATVARGYWRNEQANADSFGAATAGGEEGFLRTGDLGTLYRGELYVTGRIKDVLVIRGRNLYPQDIEHELRAQYPELETSVGAVFAVPASGTPQDDLLVVTHEIRGRFSEDRLRTIATGMKQTVASEFGVGVDCVALLRPGTVPRTTSGKIQRTATRQLFLEDALSPRFMHADTRVRGRLGTREAPSTVDAAAAGSQ